MQVRFNDERKQRALNNIYRVVASFNTRSGYISWTLASYEEKDVAVFDTRAVKYMIEFCVEPMVSSRLDNIDPKVILEFLWKHMNKEPVPVCFKSEAFNKLIVQTPFSASPAVDGTRRAKENEKWFFIVRADDMKTFYKSVSDRKVLELNSVQEKCLDLFGQTYACVPWKQKPRWLGKELTYDKKRTLPAMGVPWWRELFTAPVRRFFDMQEPVHMVGSKADRGEVVVAFEEIVRRW